MRVYRIEYQTYEYISDELTSMGSDWFPVAASAPKFVKASSTSEAIAALRADIRGAIEVASIQVICAIDVEQQFQQ